jgi:long-chain acyl-CoA synthetase
MAHVWEKSYPSGVYWDCSLAPAVTLGSLLETAATMWPDRMAVDFYDRTFTYRELHDLAAKAAKGLQAIGVGPGVHVGLHLPNTPHFVICFFAVLMAGGRVSGQQTEPWSGFIRGAGYSDGVPPSIWDSRWSPPRGW